MTAATSHSKIHLFESGQYYHKIRPAPVG